MKISRLYTMDMDNIIKLTAIQNKSALVNKAVRKYFKEKEAFNASDLDTLVLVAILSSRFEKGTPMALQIESIYKSLKTDK